MDVADPAPRAPGEVTRQLPQCLEFDGSQTGQMNYLPTRLGVAIPELSDPGPGQGKPTDAAPGVSATYPVTMERASRQ